MRPLGVVPAEVTCNFSAGCGHTIVRPEIDLLVLRTATNPFDKDVVAPGTSPIHGWLAAFGQYRICEVAGRELTPLIDVDNLWQTEACKRFFDDFNGTAGLQCDRQLVRQYPPTGHIDNGGEMHKAVRHRNAGGV